MSNTQTLIVAGQTVKQDNEGRYCLNDLQRAATEGKNSRTSELHEFMRRPETQELVTELENTGISRIKPVESKRGRNGGTYVAKELVYAYAMWISPSFNLKVIRSFDTLQTQGVAVSDDAAEDLLKNPLKYMKILMQQAEELQSKVDEYEPIVKFVTVNEYCSREGVYPPKGVAIKLGQKATKLAKERGIEVGTKDVVGFSNLGAEYKSKVNIYPLGLLEEVCQSAVAA